MTLSRTLTEEGIRSSLLYLRNLVRVDLFQAPVDEPHLKGLAAGLEHREPVDRLAEQRSWISLQRPQPRPAATGHKEVHAGLGLQMLHVMVMTGEIHIDAIAQNRQE